LRVALQDREVALFFALLAVGALALELAPSFYYHYPAFLAVPLAAVLGSLGRVGWERLKWRARSLSAAAAVLLGLLLAVSAARGGWEPRAVHHNVPVVAGARCVFADLPILLITANHFSDQPGCGYTLDSSAQVMADGRIQAGRMFQAQFIRSDAALLLWGGPQHQWGWTASTVRSFKQHFRFTRELPGGISVWTRRAP
jgi:hypothetical protein